MYIRHSFVKDDSNLRNQAGFEERGGDFLDVGHFRCPKANIHWVNSSIIHVVFQVNQRF